MEEDFQHFLSYSGFRNDTPETIEKMCKAFFAAWGIADENNPTCIYCGGTDFHHTIECYLGIEKNKA